MQQKIWKPEYVHASDDEIINYDLCDALCLYYAVITTLVSSCLISPFVSLILFPGPYAVAS